MLEGLLRHDISADIDRRALTPLFWTHVNPYGKFTLDMDSHLDLDLPAASAAIPA